VNVSSTNFHLAPASAPENHFTVNKPIPGIKLVHLAPLAMPTFVDLTKPPGNLMARITSNPSYFALLLATICAQSTSRTAGRFSCASIGKLYVVVAVIVVVFLGITFICGDWIAA